MPASNPVADVMVKDYRPTIVTVIWVDGTRRTIATANPADLVTIGIRAKANEPPGTFEKQFAGKFVEKPRTQKDVLKIAVQRSEN